MASNRKLISVNENNYVSKVVMGAYSIKEAESGVSFTDFMLEHVFKNIQREHGIKGCQKFEEYFESKRNDPKEEQTNVSNKKETKHEIKANKEEKLIQEKEKSQRGRKLEGGIVAPL